MLISNILMDWVVPLFPVYQGDDVICICMSVFSGIGYALIYMRDTSTGGADFVLMAIHRQSHTYFCRKNYHCYGFYYCNYWWNSDAWKH